MRSLGTSRHGAAAVAVLALAGGAVGAVSTPPSASATASAAAEVPVAGTFSYHVSQDAQKPLVHGAVHAVRRLAGATVVYYSLGFAAGTEAQWYGTTPNVGLADDYGPYDVSAVAVVDTSGLTY